MTMENAILFKLKPRKIEFIKLKIRTVLVELIVIMFDSTDCPNKRS